MDKPLSKKLINKNGVKVAKELLLSTNPDQRENELRSFFAENGEVVLKPTDDGSSRGLKFIRTDQDLTDALVELRNQTRAYLVETYISGRELTVGVLEKSDGSLIPLPCSEVELDPGRIFDYDAKYLGKGCREITPARITADEARRAQEVALIAHKTFGCKSYSRTDVILQPDSVFFLETNTLPGITKASFYPQQLAAAGIGFEQFLKTVLDLSK
nr:D-ala D-ala ligase C-terminus [uncultured bacterium]